MGPPVRLVALRITSRMQSPAERHSFILKRLTEQGFVAVASLSEDLDVSEVTIRRDLKHLEQRNLLFRTHGGAAPTNPFVYDRPVSEKAKQNADEKRRIGAAAADLVEQNDSILLASGTTIHQVARHLQGKSDLTVVTSALHVATELLNLPRSEVFVLGGMLRRTSTSVAGPAAEEMMGKYRCRTLFLGADGVDLDYGLTTSNSLEASLNQRMIEAVQQTILVTDSSKFGRRGFSHICNVDEIDIVITDDGAPEGMVRALEDRGVRVITV